MHLGAVLYPTGMEAVRNVVSKVYGFLHFVVGFDIPCTDVVLRTTTCSAFANVLVTSCFL